MVFSFLSAFLATCRRAMKATASCCAARRLNCDSYVYCLCGNHAAIIDQHLCDACPCWSENNNCEHGYSTSLNGLLQMTQWIYLTYNISAKPRLWHPQSYWNRATLTSRALFKTCTIVNSFTFLWEDFLTAFRIISARRFFLFQFLFTVFINLVMISYCRLS